MSPILSATFWPWLLGAVACAVVTLATTAVTLAFLRKRQILDRPNERSSHTRPTPRGLGLGLIPVVIGAWVIACRGSHEVTTVCVMAGALSLVSWVDDVKPLPAAPRLLAQIGAVVAGLWVFAPPAPLPWLPATASAAVSGVLWVGLINQVNFTDGIDGHLGAMTACLGLGLFSIWLVTGGHGMAGPLALLLAGAAAAFLRLNWHRAKAFMGDVGSVPLGYLVGWLLLRTAADGQWMVAIVLPLFYFVDTAVTYGGRLARCEPFWRPHRLYLYQRAASVVPHGRVVSTVVLCNVALLGIALVAVATNQWLGMVALLPVALVYQHLSKLARPR